MGIPLLLTVLGQVLLVTLNMSYGDNICRVNTTDIIHAGKRGLNLTPQDSRYQGDKSRFRLKRLYLDGYWGSIFSYCPYRGDSWLTSSYFINCDSRSTWLWVTVTVAQVDIVKEFHFSTVQTYGRFGHLSTKIVENTNSNYSFNFQYIGILSDQTLENSHSDILIRRIFIFWEIEWVKQSNVSNRFD